MPLRGKSAQWRDRQPVDALPQTTEMSIGRRCHSRRESMVSIQIGRRWRQPLPKAITTRPILLKGSREASTRLMCQRPPGSPADSRTVNGWRKLTMKWKHELRSLPRGDNAVSRFFFEITVKFARGHGRRVPREDGEGVPAGARKWPPKLNCEECANCPRHDFSERPFEMEQDHRQNAFVLRGSPTRGGRCTWGKDGAGPAGMGPAIR